MALVYRWIYSAHGKLTTPVNPERPAITVEVGRSKLVDAIGGGDPSAPGTLATILAGVLEQIRYPDGPYTHHALARAAEAIGTAVSTVGGRVDYCRTSCGEITVTWMPEEANR